MSQARPFLHFNLDRNRQKLQFIQSIGQQFVQPCGNGLLIARDDQAVNQRLRECPICRNGITSFSEHLPIERQLSVASQLLAGSSEHRLTICTECNRNMSHERRGRSPGPLFPPRKCRKTCLQEIRNGAIPRKRSISKLPPRSKRALPPRGDQARGPSPPVYACQYWLAAT